MYNRVNLAQNKRLMLKSCFTGINISILSKKIYENIFFEKLVNELYSWIENHPHVIHFPDVKGSFFVKINGNLVKKQTHLIQISV